MEAISFTPTTSQDTIQPQAEVTASVGEGYVPYAPLFEKFGIEGKGTERTQKALATIWDWAKSRAESPATEHVVWQVTKLMTKLGDSPYGFPTYMKALNYITTYNTMVEAEKRMQQLEAHA